MLSSEQAEIPFLPVKSLILGLKYWGHLMVHGSNNNIYKCFGIKPLNCMEGHQTSEFSSRF